MSKTNAFTVLMKFRNSIRELGNDFLKICHVEKQACQRKESASARFMVPDPTCLYEPVSLCHITSDYFFPNPLSPFGHGPFFYHGRNFFFSETCIEMLVLKGGGACL